MTDEIFDAPAAGKKKPGVRAKQVFDLSTFKQKAGFDESVKDKPLEWIRISDAFTQATGLPGFPKGYMSLLRGFSNTGKSTAAFEAAVACQKAGILPVIIDTESNMSWDHLRHMGFQFTTKGDENGEVAGYDGFFLYANTEYLTNNYGKVRDKNRDQAVVEDVAYMINDLLDQQNAGDLPHELCFIWDSIGTLDCEKGVLSKSSNNMWTAGAMEAAFRNLINQRIPISRKEGKPYTNTFIGVQKIWLDSSGMGQPVVKHKGGEAFFYGARLIVHFGGTLSHGTEKLKAERKGIKYQFGIQTNVRVEKNQVNGASLEGKIVSTPHGFVAPDGITDYKRQNADYFDRNLGGGGGDFEIATEKDNSPASFTP